MSYSNKQGPSILIIFCLLITSCSNNVELKWVNEDGYKWAEIKREYSFTDKTGFTKINKKSGIDFINSITEEQVSQNRVLINGSGVTAGDIDGDGLPDIYFGSINGPNKLYRNLGNWTFKEITEQAGVGMEDYQTSGVALADLDSDEDLDLIVTTYGDGNKVFTNNGNGIFKEKVDALDTRVTYGSHSIALADIERDGDLDIYITNYKKRSAKDLYPKQRSYGDIVKREGDNYSIYPKFRDHYRLEERGEFILWFEKGESDLLFLNDGKGNFKNVSSSTNIFQESNGNQVSLKDFDDWGLHAKFFDFNNDLYPDLYVCNDFESPDRVWLNKGDGTFRELDKTAIRNTSLSSMSVDFSDINHDGHTDIFIAEMLAKDRQKRTRDLGTMIPLPEPIGIYENRPQYVGNTLMLNRGDETFANITDYAGIRGSDWTWGSKFLDVDLDGFDDLILTNGNYYDSQDLDANNRLQQMIRTNEIDPEKVMLQYPKLEQTNIIFRNKGDLTFEDKSDEWGFNVKDISHGFAVADFDNDGDQDLVINKMNHQAALYKNETTADRVAIKLIGDSLNTHAIGSKIEISSEGLRQFKEVTATGSYLSGAEFWYTFAALEDSLNLKVTWFDGTISKIKGLKKNRLYEFDLTEMRVQNKPKPQQKDYNAIFTDVSDILNHRHHESYYDDFDKKQHLLPYRLSQPGPGVSWYDLNEDGYDDLLIGDGKGGELSIFLNKKGKDFKRIRIINPDILKVSKNDLSGILALPGSNEKNIAVGKFNYETKNEKSKIALFDLNQSELSVVVLDSIMLSDASAPGPLTSADYDKDGDLDLFVGGRAEAGKFPAAATSWFLKNIKGRFIIDESNKPIKSGMITSAVFSDVNNDTWPDLLLTRDWNSIQLLINEDGSFKDKSEEWELTGHNGLWRGISTGDFNNDGRLDLIAGNIGLNNIYKNLIENGKGIHLYFYPRSNIGTSIIESYYSEKLGGWTPLRRLPELGKEFSILGKRVKSHHQYSNSTIEELFGIGLENFNSVNANSFSTALFINNGNSFEFHELPLEAQLSSTQGISIADFNSDGNEDIFLGQNFFAHPVERPRQDAGRGLLLLGNGSGDFSSQNAQSSGIKIYGEQRATAASDFNRDGRIDLVVTQNGMETKLYMNQSPGKGIAIGLHYRKNNPDGVGAKLNFIYPNGNTGPVREIKLGEGYLSQQSMTQVMGYSTYPTWLSITWPDGRKDKIELPKGLLELTVNAEGQIIDRRME